MNRIEFMKELEYLLQDIPDEDKADALDYYRDYLEEAGDMDEQSVLDEFGSPERIAAIIRGDLSGNLEEGGEFTDRGYQDSRYTDPRYQVARRLDLPEEVTDTVSGGFAGGKPADEKKPAEHNGWKIACWILLAIICSPLIISGVAVLFGAVVSVVAVVASVAFTILLLVVVFGVVAVALIGYGISQLFVLPLQGLLIMGTGILMLGLTLLMIVVAYLFFGKLLPAVFRFCTNGLSRLFHRKGGSKG